jgi:acetylglutamate kinase
MSPALQPHRQTRQTIVRLLSSMASAKEISQYLKRFSQLDAKRFAVVKVGGAVLRDDLDALTSSLSFLQEVGLTPIVLHGAGPQLDAELSAAGIEKQTVNGLRVTSPEALAIVRRVFQQSNLRLVEALQQNGARATSITGGVFEAEYLDVDTYGLVGEVKRSTWRRSRPACAPARSRSSPAWAKPPAARSSTSTPTSPPTSWCRSCSRTRSSS